MATATIDRAVAAAGKTFRQRRTPVVAGVLLKDPTLPAAAAGTLATRADDDTGTLTMNPGHGVQTGDRLDVYWAGGSRYGMAVGTVATNSVPVGGGGGDDLPAQGAAVTAMVPRLETFACAEAELATLFVGCPGVRCTAVFRTAAPADALVVRTGTAEDYAWDAGEGAGTPVGGDVADVYLSHGSAAGPRQVSVVALVDTVPAAAPLLLSATIDTAGTTCTLAFDRPVAGGAGFQAFATASTLATPASALRLTYSSGNGTDTLAYSITRPTSGSPLTPVAYGEDAFTLSYNAAFGNVTAVTGGLELAAFSGFPVANGSTQNAPTPAVSGGDVDASATGINVFFSAEVAATGVSASDWLVTSGPRSFAPDAVVRTALKTMAFDWGHLTPAPTKYVLQGEGVQVTYTPGAVAGVWGDAMAGHTQSVTNLSELFPATPQNVEVQGDGVTLLLQWNFPAPSILTIDGTAAGFVLQSAEKGAVGMTLVSDPGMTNWTFTLDETITATDTVTLDYTPGDAAMNVTSLQFATIDVSVPVAAFSGFSVANGSSQ